MLITVPPRRHVCLAIYAAVSKTDCRLASPTLYAAAHRCLDTGGGPSQDWMIPVPRDDIGELGRVGYELMVAVPLT